MLVPVTPRISVPGDRSHRRSRRRSQSQPMGGIAFVRWLRNSPDSPTPLVHVIMVTGHSTSSRVTEARDVGVTEILSKPITATGVLDRITRVVDILAPSSAHQIFLDLIAADIRPTRTQDLDDARRISPCRASGQSCQKSLGLAPSCGGYRLASAGLCLGRRKGVRLAACQLAGAPKIQRRSAPCPSRVWRILVANCAVVKGLARKATPASSTPLWMDGVAGVAGRVEHGQTWMGLMNQLRSCGHSCPA